MISTRREINELYGNSNFILNTWRKIYEKKSSLEQIFFKGMY